MPSWRGAYSPYPHDHYVQRVFSFSSTVGQFVLTASLRSQVNPANQGEFKQVSPERSVYLFTVGSRNSDNMSDSELSPTLL
jgi:hypothetical protein